MMQKPRARTQVTDEVYISVRIPADLAARLRLAAVQAGMTIDELFVEIAKTVTERYGDADVPRPTRH